MKAKDYIQTDDFSQMEIGDKIDYLSKQSPAFKKLPLPQQREYIMTKTKQPTYKPRDFLSKAGGFALPMAGQLAGETLAGAGEVLAAPETAGASLIPGIAGVMAAGGAGAAAGETLNDVINYKRGMGPRPSMKSEMASTPLRMGFGAAGSGMGMGMSRVLKIPKVQNAVAGTLEAVAKTPRLFTKALLRGATKGVDDSPEAIAKAAQGGEEAIAKYEADAQQKIMKIKEEMGEHWKKQKYGDPVAHEFEAKVEPNLDEFKKMYGKNWAKPYYEAVQEFQKGAAAPKPEDASLKGIYNRFMKTVRNRGKLPPEEEVPELVRTKRLAQSKINFDKVNTNAEQKLAPEDFRRLGKITQEADKRIMELDPKQKALEQKLSTAYDELAARKSEHTVKSMGGRGYPGRFQEKFASEVARPAKGLAGTAASASGERTIGEMRNIESKTGSRFVDPLINKMAKSHYSKFLPQGGQPWMRRMAIASPVMLGTALASGKVSPYWASMLPLMAMMSPAAAGSLLTTGMRYGPDAMAQFARAMKEPDKE